MPSRFDGYLLDMLLACRSIRVLPVDRPGKAFPVIDCLFALSSGRSRFSEKQPGS